MFRILGQEGTGEANLENRGVVTTMSELITAKHLLKRKER